MKKNEDVCLYYYPLLMSYRVGRRSRLERVVCNKIWLICLQENKKWQLWGCVGDLAKKEQKIQQQYAVWHHWLKSMSLAQLKGWNRVLSIVWKQISSQSFFSHCFLNTQTGFILVDGPSVGALRGGWCVSYVLSSLWQYSVSNSRLGAFKGLKSFFCHPWWFYRAHDKVREGYA